MYLRPVIFSTTPWLGLTQCAEAMILVLCCPVGPYFKSGFVPIKLSVDSKYIRAWPGGTGNVKSGGNYGPTVISQAAATANGASQSLFVYDKHEYVTEAGTMNIFFLIRNEQGVKQLITPSLKDGTILPGVTRQSVIELSQQWNECETVEKMIPFAEIKAAFERGDVLEIFGTGTAAVIQPINGIVYEGKEYKPVVPFDDSMLQVRLTNFLIGVQYGDIDHPWSHVVPPSTTWSKPM
jgi:branched-chain amino acid aminotransferase|tara:strand:- start:324 stop:1034 length:711 start_codon:yes stop_codon:yes gene_type:complete